MNKEECKVLQIFLVKGIVIFTLLQTSSHFKNIYLLSINFPRHNYIIDQWYFLSSAGLWGGSVVPF